jgi:hypothetical protein
LLRFEVHFAPVYGHAELGAALLLSANKRHTPLKLPRNLVSTCRTVGGLHVGAAIFSS